MTRCRHECSVMLQRMPRASNIDAQLALIAARQHGAFSRQQALDDGVSVSGLHRRERSGSVLRVFGTSYLLGHAAVQLDPRSVAAAAVLAGGQGSAAALEWAGSTLGVWNRGPSIAEVISPRRLRPLVALELKASRTSHPIADDDIVPIDGTPTTSAARTCCDLAARLTPWQLAYVIAESGVRHGVELDDLCAILDERPGWPWTRNARRAMTLRSQRSWGTRVKGEDLFLGGVLRPSFGHGVPLVNTRGATGLAWVEADFVFEHHGVIVEIDGEWTHDEEADRERDELHAEMGWITERVPSLAVWRDLPGTLRRIDRVLRSRPPTSSIVLAR